MTLLGELRVPARHDNLRTISYFIHGIGYRLSLSDKALFDLELAVEEAATNIINHAYPGEQKGDILLEADEVGDFVQLTLTDWGVPLNPNDVKPFDINEPIETRIKGGMGLHFIHRLMDGVERETTSELGQPNRLKLVKLIEHARPGVRAPSAVQELNAMRIQDQVRQLHKVSISLEREAREIYKSLLESVGPRNGGRSQEGQRPGKEFDNALPKGDIHEEVVRLKSHVEGLSKLGRERGTVGKKMDFLLQETQRELSTIGAKATQLSTVGLVLSGKEKVEKIREQVQNVE